MERWEEKWSVEEKEWEEKWSVEEKEWEEINGILRFEFPFLCVIRWHARKKNL
jgi:hypothetical protein